MRKPSEMRQPDFSVGLKITHITDLPKETQEWLKNLKPPAKEKELATLGPQWARGKGYNRTGGETW